MLNLEKFFDPNKTYFFVKARHKASGGYGATPYLPATIEDTYHAVEIVVLLEKLFPKHNIRVSLNEKDIQFLKNKWEEGEFGLKNGYQLLNILSIVDLKPAKEIIKDWLLSRLTHLNSIENLYFFYKICQKIKLEKISFQRKRFFYYFSDQTLQTIKEIYFSLYLQKEIFKNFSNREKRKWLSWIKGCQNGDGGFGFKPGTTSFIENTHYALKILSLFNFRPSYLEKVFGFILACYKKDGGFSRKSGAASFLDATWHALHILFLLNT